MDAQMAKDPAGLKLMLQSLLKAAARLAARED
jgi:hypothetical protein